MNTDNCFNSFLVDCSTIFKKASYSRAKLQDNEIISVDFWKEQVYGLKAINQMTAMEDQFKILSVGSNQEINGVCLPAEEGFEGSWLNVTVLEPQARDIQNNHHQAIMILNRKLHTNLAEKSISCHMFQQLRLLQRLTNLLNQQLIYLPNLLDKIVQEICDAIDDAQFCFLALHNTQTKQLELTTKVGKNVDQLFLLQSSSTTDLKNPVCNHVPDIINSGLIYQVFATGIPQLFQQNREIEESVVQGCPVFLHPCLSMFSCITPSSIYAIAIESVESGRLGVLAIGNWEDTDALNLTAQNLLNAVVGVVAIAINQVKMAQALKEQEKRLAKQTETLLKQTLELEKNRQQIQLQNLQLLEAAKLKSQFLATTSHELRTPLNVILGLSQVLLRQRSASLSEQQTYMVQRILSNGNHLLEIIEDMLYFAKVKAGCLALKTEEFNLAALVLTTVAEYHYLAEEKLLNLQVNINLNHPFVVNDSSCLKQVLVKLLLNAIKFTENGGIVVKLWEISSDRIAIAVQDSGIGIAESDLEDIFEQFCQVDQTTTRKYSGTGLGLAITKSLVEIIQGTITVTSKPSEGSTFCIELPRKIELSC